VETVMTQTYGAIVLRSTPMPFTQTTYYECEMGANLTRLYIAFDPLISIAALATVKRLTNQLEAGGLHRKASGVSISIPAILTWRKLSWRQRRIIAIGSILVTVFLLK